MIGIVALQSAWVAPTSPMGMSLRSAAHMSAVEMDLGANDPYNPFRHIATPFAGPGSGVGAAPRGTLIRPFVDATLSMPTATSTGKVVPSLATSIEMTQPVTEIPTAPEPSPAASTPATPVTPVAPAVRTVATMSMDDTNSPYNPWLGRTIYPFASHGVGAVPMGTPRARAADRRRRAWARVDTTAPSATATVKKQSKDERWGTSTPDDAIEAASLEGKVVPTKDANSAYEGWRGRTIYPFASHGVGAAPVR